MRSNEPTFGDLGNGRPDIGSTPSGFKPGQYVQRDQIDEENERYYFPKNTVSALSSIQILLLVVEVICAVSMQH